MRDGEPRTGVVATAEMHATKAMASAMTAAEMSATAVTTAAMSTAAMSTAAVSTSRQRRTRQHGRDNQNGNSNAGLRHVICSGLIAYSNDAGRNRKFPRRSQLRVDIVAKLENRTTPKFSQTSIFSRLHHCNTQ
jgi:hypothetical protein